MWATINWEECNWPLAVHILITESTFDWQESQSLMLSLPTCTNYLVLSDCYAGLNIYVFTSLNTESKWIGPDFCNHLHNDKHEESSDLKKDEWMKEWNGLSVLLQLLRPPEGITESAAEQKTTPVVGLSPSPTGKTSGSPRTTKICGNQWVPGDWSGKNN